MPTYDNEAVRTVDGHTYTAKIRATCDGIPATLRRYASKIASIVDERSVDNGFWVNLKRGYIDTESGCQAIHEDTLRACASRFAFVEAGWRTVMPLTTEQLGTLAPGTPLLWRRPMPGCSYARKIQMSVQFIGPYDDRRAAVFGVADQQRHLVTRIDALCVDTAANIRFVPAHSKRLPAKSEHALLTAAFEIPHLKRKAGWLLCGASDASYSVEDPVGTRVSCPRCRALLLRAVGARGTWCRSYVAAPIRGSRFQCASR